MGGYLVVSLTSNSVRRNANRLLLELTLHYVDSGVWIRTNLTCGTNCLVWLWISPVRLLGHLMMLSMSCSANSVMSSSECRKFNWQFFHALVSGNSLKTCTTLLPLLLPHLHFNSSNTLQLEFLDVINGSLVKMYPPTSEDIVIALPILKGVARAVEGCESENIVKFLVILKDGLGLWIRDEAKALPESDHNTIVRCFLICLYFL